MNGRPLHWIEWLELGTRIMLVLLLLGLASIQWQILLAIQHDSGQFAWAWAQAELRHAEIVRLGKVICLQTGTIYDVKRGVCDPKGTAEPPRWSPPAVTPGLSKKKPDAKDAPK